jgi:maltose alpha-D-glucosyltransferase/alpha-amylase
MRNLMGRTLRLLQGGLERFPAALAERGRALVQHPQRLFALVDPLLRQRLTGLRIRVHGDYHLNQLLSTGRDFVVIDFQGPAGDTLEERRRKHSVFRDVASMIRSFHYAAATTLLDGTVVREIDRHVVAPWAEAWHRCIAGAFLRSYLEATAGAPFLPGAEELGQVVETHLLEKALWELGNELELEGETPAVPLEAILDLVDAEGP